MRHLVKIMLPVLFAAIGICSCQETAEVPSYIYPDYTSYSFGCMQDTVNIFVQSNVDWSIDKDAAWFYADKIEDENGTWLQIIADENMEIEPRTSAVTLAAGTLSVSVTLVQKGASFTGIFEDLPDYPLTYHCVPSKNLKFLLGVRQGDAAQSAVADIINVETGEIRSLEPSMEYDLAVAISDDGNSYILNSRKYGKNFVYINNELVELTVPEGYKEQGMSIGGISGDGRVVIGALNSATSGQGRFPCRWVDLQCEILERPETSSHGTPTAPYGTLARDCNADGSVSYGTEWTSGSYALCFWRDGKMFYPGGDYAVMNGSKADRICKTAEFLALSPNGRYLAARYETTTGSAYPVIIDTENYGEEGSVKILKDVSSSMTGLTCSDDGLLFAASPHMGVSEGHVIDPEAGTCVTTKEWFKSEYGLNISSGRMIDYVSPDRQRFFGTQARMGVRGTEYSFWYLNLNPEK